MATPIYLTDFRIFYFISLKSIKSSKSMEYLRLFTSKPLIKIQNQFSICDNFQMLLRGISDLLIVKAIP